VRNNFYDYLAYFMTRCTIYYGFDVFLKKHNIPSKDNNNKNGSFSEIFKKVKTFSHSAD